MSKILVTQSKIENIADAIRAKAGINAEMTLDEMTTAISNISSGGGGGSGNTYIMRRLIEKDGVSHNDDYQLIDNDITQVGSYAFSDVSGGFSLISFPNATSIKSYAFYRFTGNVGTVLNFPSVTNIGAYAFNSVQRVRELNLPAVTDANENYIFQCSNFTKISMPVLSSQIKTGALSLLTYLQEIDLGFCTNLTGTGTSSAFYNCPSLEKIIFRKTDGVCAYANSASNRDPAKAVDGTIRVYVPDALVSSYQTATNWSRWYAYSSDIFQPLSSLDDDE